MPVVAVVGKTFADVPDCAGHVQPLPPRPTLARPPRCVGASAAVAARAQVIRSAEPDARRAKGADLGCPALWTPPSLKPGARSILQAMHRIPLVAPAVCGRLNGGIPSTVETRQVGAPEWLRQCLLRMCIGVAAGAARPRGMRVRTRQGAGSSEAVAVALTRRFRAAFASFVGPIALRRGTNDPCYATTVCATLNMPVKRQALEGTGDVRDNSGGG